MCTPFYAVFTAFEDKNALFHGELPQIIRLRTKDFEALCPLFLFICA